MLNNPTSTVLPVTAVLCPAESVWAAWCSGLFPALLRISLPHFPSELLPYPEVLSDFSEGHSGGPAGQKTDSGWSLFPLRLPASFTLTNALTWLCFSVTSLCCSTSWRSEMSLSFSLIRSSPCLWLCLSLLWLASNSRPRENRELCTPTSSLCSWASATDSLTPSGA